MREYVGMVMEEAPVKARDIQQASVADPLISRVIKRVVNGAWRDCDPMEEPYYRVRDQLTVIDGVLLIGNRYVIPESVRPAVLRIAHEGHPGTDAFLDTVRTRVWWPGHTKDAVTFAERCSICWRRRTNHAQGLQPSEIESVWNKVVVDLVTVERKTCLSVVDYGSRYPEVIPLTSTTSAMVIAKLMEIFARFGLPSVMVSDNGLQFVSAEMERFLLRLGIQHVKSSPRYPQSNGMVERLHRLIRERLQGLRPAIPFPQRLQQILLDIRNARHRMLGTSPSEALFSRVLRTRVPTHIPPVIVNPRHQVRAKAQMVGYHDSKRGVRPLPTLTPGTVVILQDGYTDPERHWKVVEQHGQQVGVSDGQRILLRNRRHVREYQSLAQPEFRIPDSGEYQSLTQLEFGIPDTQTSTDRLGAASSPQPTSEEALLKEHERPMAREPSHDNIISQPERAMTTTGQPFQDITASLPVETQPASSVNRDSPGETGLPILSDLRSPQRQCQSLYKEGRVTRSGRQIKLTARAKEADM